MKKRSAKLSDTAIARREGIAAAALESQRLELTRELEKLMVDPFNHMVASGAEGNQILTQVAGSHQGAHRGKFGGNFILCHRIDSTTALPIGEFLQGEAQSLCGFTAVCIQFFTLGFQGTAGKIAHNHSSHPPVFRRKYLLPVGV